MEALDDTEHNIPQQDEATINIVKPPADFADSPDQCTSHHQRLYKKLDRRLRSEERHGERKHYRSRQESVRAKVWKLLDILTHTQPCGLGSLIDCIPFQSEERAKTEASKEQSLRPAGSSPCVTVDNSFNVRTNIADPEQGIYHGFYRIGLWICLHDGDVWRRNDFAVNDGNKTSYFHCVNKRPSYYCISDRAKELSDRRPSTESEKDFRKKHQAITHRLVHRKSCVEMYRRQSSNTFGKGFFALI